MSRVYRQVTTTADSGAGSLREAIEAGSVPNISFAPSVTSSTFNKSTQLWYPGDDLILQGTVVPDSRVRPTRRFRRHPVAKGLAAPARDLQQLRPKFTGQQFFISGHRAQVRYIDFYSDYSLGGDGRALMLRRTDDDIAIPIYGMTIENCDFHGAIETCLNLDGIYQDVYVTDCNFSNTYWADQGKVVHLAATSFLVDGQFVRYMPNALRASVFTRCSFSGFQRIPRIIGGVHFFYDCDFYVSALGGPSIRGGRGSFHYCRFHSMPQPSGASFWYYAGGPWPITVSPYDGNIDIGEPEDPLPLEDSVYTEGCTLDGVAKTTDDLVWEWVNGSGLNHPVKPVVNGNLIRRTPFPGAL